MEKDNVDSVVSINEELIRHFDSLLDNLIENHKSTSDEYLKILEGAKNSITDLFKERPPCSEESSHESTQENYQEQQNVYREVQELTEQAIQLRLQAKRELLQAQDTARRILIDAKAKAQSAIRQADIRGDKYSLPVEISPDSVQNRTFHPDPQYEVNEQNALDVLEKTREDIIQKINAREEKSNVSETCENTEKSDVLPQNDDEIPVQEIFGEAQNEGYPELHLIQPLEDETPDDEPTVTASARAFEEIFDPIILDIAPSPEDTNYILEEETNIEENEDNIQKDEPPKSYDGETKLEKDDESSGETQEEILPQDDFSVLEESHENDDIIETEDTPGLQEEPNYEFLIHEQEQKETFGRAVEENIVKKTQYLEETKKFMNDIEKESAKIKSFIQKSTQKYFSDANSGEGV